MQYNKEFVDKITEYHKWSRRRKFEKTGPFISHIKLHNQFHKLLVYVISFLRKTRGQELIKVSDKRERTDRPIIYAATHIGGNDIETCFEAIKDPAYLFLGDPREIYCNFDGLMLFLNGVICMETDDKYDRKIARANAVELLKKGGSLLLYPEGAWNIFPDWPVMPLYAGALDMAVEAKADIIPIALELYDKTYLVSIGKNIHYEDIDITDKSEASKKLRDVMATLKWEVFEAHGLCKRKDIPSGFYKEFLSNILATKDTSFTEQDVYNTMFIPKDIVKAEDVFKHLKEINIGKHNAFLCKEDYI